MSNLANNFDLKDEKQAQEYLDTVGIEYRFQCYHEKKPDGCHRLADFLETFRKDLERAGKLYETNCEENKFGHSCFKSGLYHYLGKAGVKKDIKASYTKFEKGCEFGHAPSCTNAAMLHHAGKINESGPDYKKAAELFQKACDGRDSGSCHYLSSYYLTGKDGIPKDPAKALEIAMKGCDLGHMGSCHNISLMYKNSDGVEKNMELSKKFKEKAEDLQREHQEVRRYIDFGK